MLQTFMDRVKDDFKCSSLLFNDIQSHILENTGCHLYMGKQLEEVDAHAH